MFQEDERIAGAEIRDLGPGQGSHCGESSQREEEGHGRASLGAGHRVVVEGLGTCQDSHLTGKPRAGQGPPLRVAQGGPMGYGRGPPNHAHGRRIVKFDCTTLLITGPRCMLLRLQEWTQTFHRGYGGWWSHRETDRHRRGRKKRERWEGRGEERRERECVHLLDKSCFRDGVVAVGVELPKNVRESLQHEGCVFHFHLPPEVRVLASALQGLVDKHSSNQVEERQRSEDNVDHQEGTVHRPNAVQDHQHVVPVNAAEDHHEQRKHGHGERPKEATHILDVRICVGRVQQVLCGTVHEGQRKEKYGHGEDQDGPQKHDTGTGDRGRHRVELRDAGREAQETKEAKGPKNLHDAEHAEGP